ncbi:hypothetical protein BDZ45DRAFT_625729 [Acephala macrosclerotiorum]|nr:hypothetical protein BDZ45DRAFT_625729 [Acephala macrosclerotiorum]
MVRDLRLELEKRLYQKRSAVPFAIISCPRPIAEFDLRSKIVGRVQFIKEEPESQYFTYVDLLKRSFSQTRMSASSRRPSHSSKAGNPRTSTIQRTTVCTSSNGKRASWSSPRWEKKQKLSSSSAQPVSVESHNASEDDSGNLNDSNLNKLTGTPESKPGAQFRGQYNYHPNYQYNSPTPRRPQQRNSPYFGASSGEPNKNANEYVDYLIDGVIYRAYNSQTKRSGYRYRGHGAARDSDYRLCSPYYFSLNAKLPPTYGSAAHIHRGDPEYDFVMHEGKVCPKPKQWEQPSYNDAPCRRRRSSTPARPYTQPAQSKKAPLTRKATEEDARRHRIPPGYSIKNWDPTEEPIMLLGSVFDANSLGKWIYDWTVYHHGPATPIADMSGELWLLLIQLAGKVKRAEESIDRVRRSEDKEMVDDFIESGERLFNKLKKLLKSCQEPMLKAGKKKGNDSAQLGKNAGTEFVDSIFGRDRQLEATEKFMASIRLWNLRFDANCEDILRNLGGASLPPYGEERSNDGWKSHPSKKSDVDDTIVLSPVSIRTAFGLEAIPENRRIT